jgi:hypothetical protein
LAYFERGRNILDGFRIKAVLFVYLNLQELVEKWLIEETDKPSSQDCGVFLERKWRLGSFLLRARVASVRQHRQLKRREELYICIIQAAISKIITELGIDAALHSLLKQFQNHIMVEFSHRGAI